MPLSPFDGAERLCARALCAREAAGVTSEALVHGEGASFDGVVEFNDVGRGAKSRSNCRHGISTSPPRLLRDGKVDGPRFVRSEPEIYPFARSE